MFTELVLDKLKESKIVIYGIGNNGTYTYQFLKCCGINIVGFADIKARENGFDSFLGHICMPIEQYENKELITVIVTPYWSNEILMMDIQKMGFKECVSWNEMESLFQWSGVCVHNSEVLDKLISNVKYKNLYSKKRCFILGTGPSIKNQDLKALKNEYVFSVNTGYNISQFDDINPQFHIFVDSMYFTGKYGEEETRIFIETLKEKLKGRTCFFPYTKSINFISKNHLHEYLDINFIEEDIHIGWDDANLDFTGVTPLTGTVVITAILLALYMGFEEIYLLGCDCTDILTTIASKQKELGEVSYAWENNVNQQKRLEKTLGKRKLELIYRIQYIKFKNFRILDNICKNKGIKLYDATPNGLLDCIEKVEFQRIEFED